MDSITRTVIPVLLSMLAGLLPMYVIRFSIGGIPTNLFEVGVWVVFALTVVVSSVRKQFVNAVRTLPRYTKLFVCLFVISAIISTLYSPVLHSSLGILKGWIITPILFGLLLRSAVCSDKNIEKNIVRSLILSGVVVALLGLSQINGFARVRSIYDVPNSLALFLVPIFSIAIWVGIQKKDRLYILSSVIILAAIIATQSFGAVIALVGTTFAAFPLSPWGERARVRAGLRRRLPSSAPSTKAGLTFSLIREKGHYVALFLMLSILIIVVFTLSGRVQYLLSPLTHPNTTNSATVRLQLWDIGMRLIKQNPILGIGLGQFEPAYQAELHSLFAAQASGLSADSTDPPSAGGQTTTYNLQPEFLFRDPHNWIISFWLNLGMLGIISFTCLNYIALRNTLLFGKKFNQPAGALVKEGGSHAIYSQAFALALVSILVFGLFDTIYWKNDLSALWWLLLFSSSRLKGF